MLSSYSAGLPSPFRGGRKRSEERELDDDACRLGLIYHDMERVVINLFYEG